MPQPKVNYAGLSTEIHRRAVEARVGKLLWSDQINGVRVMLRDSGKLIAIKDGYRTELLVTPDTTLDQVLGQFSRRDRRDEFGCLVGMKAFALSSNGKKLRSPVQQTLWNDPSGLLTCKNFAADDGLRGVAGIHAWWPRVDDAPLPPVDRDDITCDVLCRVSGFGLAIIGPLGWRAQNCMIKAVIGPKKILQRLRSFYCLGNIEWIERNRK